MSLVRALVDKEQRGRFAQRIRQFGNSSERKGGPLPMLQTVISWRPLARYISRRFQRENLHVLSPQSGQRRARQLRNR